MRKKQAANKMVGQAAAGAGAGAVSERDTMEGSQLIGRHVVVGRIYKYFQANLIDNLGHKFSIYI